MDQFNVIHEAAQQGLPGEMLLVFTMVLWCIFTLILLADLHNKLNNWCFISGILFSVGALKEYLFYTLGPQLIQASIWTDDFPRVCILYSARYSTILQCRPFWCLPFSFID